MQRSSAQRRTIAAGILTLMMIVGMPVANADSVTVATAGDIARATIGDPQVATASLISGMNPAKVLVLGDEQYEHGEYSNFLRSYDPTWGAFNGIAAPVPGNHEYETSNAAGYFRYFAGVLSAYGATATDPSKGYYSFNVGHWHVVGLNSNCTERRVSCSAERAWMTADLEADTHLCEIVFYHHPGQTSFATLAASEGVDLALSGHRHTYERWDHKFGLDLRQLVVGTGGRSLSTPASDADAGVDAYGVVKLTLRAASYLWEFIDTSGTIRDFGSDDCRS